MSPGLLWWAPKDIWLRRERRHQDRTPILKSRSLRSLLGRQPVMSAMNCRNHLCPLSHPVLLCHLFGDRPCLLCPPCRRERPAALEDLRSGLPLRIRHSLNSLCALRTRRSLGAGVTLGGRLSPTPAKVRDTPSSATIGNFTADPLQFGNDDNLQQCRQMSGVPVQ